MFDSQLLSGEGVVLYVPGNERCPLLPPTRSPPQGGSQERLISSPPPLFLPAVHLLLIGRLGVHFSVHQLRAVRSTFFLH